MKANDTCSGLNQTQREINECMYVYSLGEGVLPIDPFDQLKQEKNTMKVNDSG